MRKGQTAIEFVILLGLMFIFFGITVISVQKMVLDTTADAKQRTIAEVQQAIVSELALAQSMPEGYGRTFTLPTDIEGNTYNITINTENEPLQDELVVTLGGESGVVYLEQNVTGTLQPGTNTLLRTNGSIVLN